MFDKFLYPELENNKNVLMALGAMAFTNGDLVCIAERCLCSG